MADKEKIKKQLAGYDGGRVVKYLQIKTGSKSTNIDKLIDAAIKKKDITCTDEFIDRYKISKFTFMTAPEQHEYLNSLL